MPGVSQTLCLYPRGFGHSSPRGTTLRHIYSLRRFSTTSLILMIERLGICFCESRSPTSLIRHERYLLHFYIFCHVFCIFRAFRAFAMFICSLKHTACFECLVYSTAFRLYLEHTVQTLQLSEHAARILIVNTAHTR